MRPVKVGTNVIVARGHTRRGQKGEVTQNIDNRYYMIRFTCGQKQILGHHCLEIDLIEELAKL